MKRSRISRIISILTTLQSGTKFDADALAESLGVSTRTIYRDFNELEAIGVPYYFDNEEGCYKIDPDFFLKPVNLTLQEALGILLILKNGVKEYPVPFRNSVLLGGIKIQNVLPSNIKDYCNTALENISVKKPAFSHISDLDKKFAIIQDCLRKRRVISMQYNSFFEKSEIKTELEPCHLHFTNRTWYVLGKSSLHKEIRTFKLGRIREMKPINRFFEKNENFDINNYFGRAWAMIPEGKLYNIELQFMPKVAKNVAEVHWHSTQKTRHNADGTTTLEFRVDGLNEISWWIMGYGDQVKVIKPKRLREMVVNAAKNCIELHSSE